MEAHLPSDKSLSTLLFTQGVLTNKLKRLPIGSPEFNQCQDELLDIMDKISALRGTL